MPNLFQPHPPKKKFMQNVGGRKKNNMQAPAYSKKKKSLN